MAKPPQPAVKPGDDAQERRTFFTKVAAVVIGGFVALVPAATGLAVFLDPLRKRSKDAAMLPVAPLGAVPDDGIPRQFPVVAEHIDAWTQSQQPIGAVYLRRLPGQEKPECLSATCPHAGCFVAYDQPTDTFKCPCHNSSFAVDGAIIEPSPSPRAMDTLESEISGGEILVKYENFYTGKAEKIVKL